MKPSNLVFNKSAQRNVRLHRFPPLLQSAHEQELQDATAAWDDYQAKFDKGYDEGLQQGHDAGFSSGEDQGKQAGYNVGFKQGLAEGHAQGRTHLESQLNDMITPLSALKETLEDGHNQHILQQQDLILELVRKVSQQVIRCELALQPTQILTLVEETLAALPDDAKHVKIHLEPTAVSKLQELAADKIKDWKLVPDEGISAGGCRVVSEHSDADASVETRLNTCMDHVANKLVEINQNQAVHTEVAQSEDAHVAD
ncbi:flagellar assembly protein FliH [Shewanella sp. OPT22]|nr:flagellar assembly protein FliH [Shewanella sp. OPT22]